MKIPYLKINPSSTTNIYYRTNKQHSKFILDQCDKIVMLAHLIPRLNIKHPKYLKQSTGTHNTAATLCEGIIKNFSTTQFDLSEKQCKALEDVFNIGADEINNFEPIEFEEVTVLPKIELPKAQEVGCSKTDDWSALSTLFDIDGVTVTLTSKK